MKRVIFAALILAFLSPVGLRATAAPFDPPPTYYSSATGTGPTLKQQLNDIIDGHTVLSYDSARTNLQVTDADPAQPGRMLTVYDRTSLHVAAINPSGPIPGWDAGATWNREHTWPQSRGVGSSGPDSSDLFALRPALSASNGDRSNNNFGGAYGQPAGDVTDNGATQWYPGDADAGMIARQAFYMATRYDGTDGNTTNLELFAGNPSTAQGMGDLNRLLQWHYAAPPDNFERRRNQVIYDQYQRNRNPFTDQPEWAWSVFVDQANDTSLTLAGGATGSPGATQLQLELGRRLVNAPLPAPQAVTLEKAGIDGTYCSVTTAGDASSNLTGRLNSFTMGASGAQVFQVGLAPSASMASAGTRTGAVTIDNLDVTTEGGGGKGANDGDDVITVELNVLDHANASFAGMADVNSLTLDFGSVTLGALVEPLAFGISNLMATMRPPPA